VLGSVLPEHKSAACTGVLLSIGFLCISLYYKKPYSGYLLVCPAFCLGFWLIQSALFPVLPRTHISNFYGHGKMQITGRVISFSKRYRRKSRVVLKCRKIKITDQAERNVCGNIYLNIFAAADEHLPEYGDVIEFVSSIRPVRNFMNPGGFDYKRFLKLKNIYGSAYVNASAICVCNLACDIGFCDDLIRKTQKFRNRCENFISARTDDSVQGKILVSLITGQKTLSGFSARDLFSKAGISHVLAISGFHLAVVSVFFFYVFYALAGLIPSFLISGRARKTAWAVSIVPLIIYAVFTGFSASTRRALIMIIMLWGAFISENENDFPSSISLAGILILLMDPGAFFSISFQLSFVSVIFIVAGLCIPGRDSFIFSSKLAAKAGIMALVTMFAGFGTFPLTARYFHIVSPVMVVSNLILIPLIGFVVLPLGLIVLVTFMFFPWLAGLLVLICEKIIFLVIEISEFLVSLPGAFFRTVTWQWQYIALIYLVMAGIFLVLKGRRKTGLFCMASVLIMVLSLVIYHGIQKKEKILQISVLDVGQGSSAFIQGPCGTAVLVDAGGFSNASSFDTGRYIVAPFLWHNKILSLDYVILTHPESDHLNGLIFILENFKVNCLVKNRDKAGTHNYKKLVRICTDRHIRIYHPSPEGEYLAAGSIIIQFAGNRPRYMRDRLNDNGLVFRIRYKDFSMLFPADISWRREKLLCCANGPDILSTILMAPHHGSLRSSSNLFLDKVSPESVIISCGWHNRYGFPHPKVIERYKKRKIRILRTDQDGAVLVFSNGSNYQIKTFKGM